MIGAVFAMQGFGQFAAALLSLVVTSGFRKHLESVKTPAACGPDCQRSVDIMWRVIIGFGGIPGWFALYYRLTIPETPRYTFDVAHNLEKATADMRAYRLGKKGDGEVDPTRQARAVIEMRAKYHTSRPVWGDFWKYFSHWKNAKALLGTAGSWLYVLILCSTDHTFISP
jgi:MFS transporter, PHS family, inorganic phosphate transporter